MHLHWPTRRLRTFCCLFLANYLNHVTYQLDLSFHSNVHAVNPLKHINQLSSGLSLPHVIVQTEGVATQDNYANDDTKQPQLVVARTTNGLVIPQVTVDMGNIPNHLEDNSLYALVELIHYVHIHNVMQYDECTEICICDGYFSVFVS